MDSDKIIRFSFPGIFFVVSFFIFNWILGGQLLKEFLGKKPDEIAAVSEIVALIISTPVLGFVLSSGPYLLLFKYPSTFRFLIPTDPNIRRDYLQSLSNLCLETISEKEDDEVIIQIHQQVLRKNVNTEQLAYTSRRFTFYLTYLNTLCAILFALLVALVVHNWHETYWINWAGVFALLFYALYICVAIVSARRNLTESCQFEIDWIRFLNRERIRSEELKRKATDA